MQSFYFLAGSALGCTLLVAGMRSLSNNLLELGEGALFNLLRSLKEKGSKSFFIGLLVSGLCGSTLTASSTLLGLVNAGLVKVRAGLLYCAGAHIGPLLLLVIFSVTGFKSALVFLSVAMVTQFLVRSSWGNWFQNTYGLLFGFGLVSLGRYFLNDGLAYFSGVDQQVLGSVTEAPFLLSLLTGLAVGSFLTFLFRSSLISILILIVFRESAFFSLGLILPAVVGVHALSFLPTYQVGRRGNVFCSRVASGNQFISMIGLLIGSLSLSFLGWDQLEGGSHTVLVFFILLRLLSVAVFLLLLKPFRTFMRKRWPEKDHPKPLELESLGRAMDMVPAMSLIQSSFHLAKFKSVVDRLFSLTERYLENGSNSGRAMAKIKDYERITDNMHKEIYAFLGKLSENSLTHNQAQTVMAHLKIADCLENIADYVDKTASYNTRYLQGGGKTEWKEEFMGFFREVREFYSEVSECLPMKNEEAVKKMQIKSQKLKLMAETIRQDHLSRLGEFEEDAMSLMTYSDMVVAVRKIRGHSFKLGLTLL